MTVLFLTISLLLATRMTAVSRLRSLLSDDSFVSACWKDLLSATEYSTRYASTSGMMGGAPDSTSASLGCNQQVQPINCIPDDYILDALDINDTAFFVVHWMFEGIDYTGKNRLDLPLHSATINKYNRLIVCRMITSWMHLILLMLHIPCYRLQT